jgi:SAM-dependent methyltransferase
MNTNPPQRQPTARDARFVGAIPELYDRYLGPLLFAPYADDLVRRVRPGESVLEIAAGTGIVSERLGAHPSPDARLTISDLNAPMLAIAERRLARRARAAVECRVADAMSLPFDDGSFDAVVSQFGVMFFPDKGQAARETYRVLRSAGQWLFNVWGSWEENSFARIVHETIAGFFPDSAPEFYRVPFSLHDPDVLRSIVVEAGFTAPTITTLDLVAEAPSAAEAAIGLVRGNPVSAAIEDRGTVDTETIVNAVASALTRAFGDHPLRFPTRARVVDARRP